MCKKQRISDHYNNIKEDGQKYSQDAQTRVLNGPETLVLMCNYVGDAFLESRSFAKIRKMRMNFN
jgi:hypothetical protein